MNTRPVAWILANYKDGDERGWDVEFKYLDEWHAVKLWELTVDVAHNGMIEPIELGYDGRVWNGHHRLRVATVLNMEFVPVHHVQRTEVTV